MIEIKYGDNELYLTIPKNLLKDKNLQNFLKYIKLKSIVNKSQATDEQIKKIVESVKNTGAKEVLEILNEE